MNRLAALLASAALLAGLTALGGPVVAAAAAATTSNTLPTGGTLLPGRSLRSADGAYVATMWSSGSLFILHHGSPVWVARSWHAGAYLGVRHDGNLVIALGTGIGWQTGTTTSGTANTLVLANNGTLMLRNANGVVWSNRLPNGCLTTTVAQRFIVSIRGQVGRMCSGWRQILTTPVTTGASALGNGTPQGTWRVRAKVPNTVLYPSSGGAYPVRFWMPYDGAYGIHDSSWQNFPYGSPLYVTRGSHGCVHLPGAAMAWFFAWAAVGTTVTITT